MLDVAHGKGNAPTEGHADAAAHQAEHDRLDEELPQDVVAAAPTAMRRPISRVRSVTETSMMFMMPTPPTTSEMAATINSRMPMIAACEAIVLVNSGHVADVEVIVRVVVLVGRVDVVPLAEQARDFVDGLRDLRRRGSLDDDVVDVDEARSFCGVSAAWVGEIAS